MNKKRLITLIVALTLVAAMGVGSTLAYFTDKTRTLQNVITMGKVEGKLEESVVKYENNKWVKDGDLKTDKGINYANCGKVLVPGEKLIKDPVLTIDSESANCYARAIITINGGNNISKGYYEIFNQIAAQMFENGWYYSFDHKFYRLDTLSAGQKVALFDVIKLPTYWDNKYALKEFNIDVQVELVQADYVTIWQSPFIPANDNSKPSNPKKMANSVSEESVEESVEGSGTYMWVDEEENAIELTFE